MSAKKKRPSPPRKTSGNRKPAPRPLRLPPRPTKTEVAPPTEAEIIASLAGRSHKVSREELEAIFGPDLAEAQRLASGPRRQVRRGAAPKVLLLPGIMGSKLGRRRKLLPDSIVWLDPLDVVTGRLTILALGVDKAIVPVGVFLSAYLMLKLRLWREGYDCDYYPFDWRKSLEQLGADLAAHVSRLNGPVAIVAHSMGGLVTRAAFKKGMKKVSRFIMLGTPNHGSLAPVEALRGQYGLAKIIAGADFANSSADLAANVFSTFPGLCEMILWRQLHPGLDLFDATRWPSGGPQPRPSLLRQAADVATVLAEPADTPGIPWYLIAGINQPTKVSAKIENGEFAYEVSEAGDGTVPLESARLSGVEQTWYVNASHGSLANTGDVRDATADILNTGSTAVLPTEAVLRTTRSRQWITETDQLRLAETRRRRGTQGFASEHDLVRAMWDEPETLEPVSPVEAADYSHRLLGVTIGRRKQRRIEIVFYEGSITDVDVRAYVLGNFSGVAPSGAANALDGLMRGAVSDLTKYNMFGARQGEIFILPTGRHPVRADFLVFTGLGAFDQFQVRPSPQETAPNALAYIHSEYVPSIEVAASNAARTLVSANVEDFATTILGGSVAGPDLRAAGESMLRGFLRGIEETDGEQHLRRVVICELDRSRYLHIKEHIIKLATTRLCDGIEFVLSEMEPPPEVSRLRALGVSVTAAVPRALEPVYLLVRRQAVPEKKDTDEWTFSWLGPTSRAALQTIGRRLTEKELADLLLPVAGDNSPANDPALRRLGEAIAHQLLPAELTAELAALPHLPLVILHDGPASKIPWETVCLKGGCPAIVAGLSRRFLTGSDVCARWKPAAGPEAKYSMLLISNPTGDLPGAEAEADAVDTALRGNRRFSIDRLAGSAATLDSILTKLSSGLYDLVHYSGHAFFDPARPDACGLICAGGKVLTGAHLSTLSRLPFLLFLNACQSGRIRKGKPTKAAKNASVTGVSVAESLLRSGIPNFLCTYWPVGDAPAADFAIQFYTSLVLHDQALGASVTAARQAISSSPDRLNYILYGNPNVSLAPGP